MEGEFKMIDKIRNNPQLLGALLLGGILLLIISAGLKSNKSGSSGSNSASPLKEIVLKTPRATKIEDMRIETAPAFDFTYTFSNETLKLKPISLLKHGQNYIVTATYFDSSSNQDLSVKNSFIYEVPGKAGEAMKKQTLSGNGFDINVEDRFNYMINVFSPDISEEKAKQEAAKILRTYDIDPSSVEFTVEFSRSAREDGVNL